MQINVRQICGNDYISRSAGKKIRDILIENWDQENFEIVLGETPIGSASFFDEAFALLITLEKKEIKELQIKLNFKDLKREDKQLLNYVLKDALKPKPR